MYRSLASRLRSIAMAGGLSIMALFVLSAGQAWAASYPAGGSTFTGGAEGWAVKSATCSVPLGLCSASGGYDGTAGNPAGSLAAKASITLNLGGLYSAAVSAESHEFKVDSGGAGTLSLQRQFVPGGLINLTPQVKYTATVIDKTAGTETQAVTESISAESGFATKGGAVSLAAGHTYAIRIDTEQSSNVASIGLLGESALRFDNVKLIDSAGNGGEAGNGTDGGRGGNGGNGSNGASASRLHSLMRTSLVGSATLRGKRLFVKATCPAAVGRACTVSLQGLLRKGRVATGKRIAKIGKGKSKRLVLQVRPGARGKVAARHRLLFKERIKAGPAKTTVLKSLKLIRR